MNSLERDLLSLNKFSAPRPLVGNTNTSTKIVNFGRSLMVAMLLAPAILGCSKEASNTIVNPSSLNDSIDDSKNMIEITREQLLAKINSGKVKSIKLVLPTSSSPNNNLYVITLTNGNKMFCPIPESPEHRNEIIKTLASQPNNPISIDVQAPTSILESVSEVLPNILIVLLVLIQLKSLGFQSWRLAKSNTKFSDIKGQDSIVATLKNLINILKNKNNVVGAKIPRGILLTGDPGTGKTLIAKAVAGEMGFNFIEATGSDFSGMFVGMSTSKVQSLFKFARKKQPCVIFIDEIESIGSKRSNSGTAADRENNRSLTRLLTEMDGFNSQGQIIVIGATNKPESLDKALTRPGRFDHIIEIAKPKTNKQREDILDLYIKKKGERISPEITAATIAKLTSDFSPSQLKAVLDNASADALQNDSKIIEWSNILEGINQVIAGVKSSIEIDSSAAEAIAVHEVLGHYLIAKILGIKCGEISLEPRVSSLGFVLLENDDKLIQRRSDLIKQLLIKLAGRAAEEHKYKEPSTGAQDDLDKARLIIEHLLTQNMLGKFTMTKITNQGTENILDRFGAGDLRLREELFDSAYTCAKQMIASIGDQHLDKLAEEALRLRVLVGADADNLLESHIPSDRIEEARIIFEKFLDNAPGTKAPRRASGI